MEKVSNQTKKFLIYVAGFRAKHEMAIKPETGRVYEATNDGSFIHIILPEGNKFIVTSPLTDNEGFYCNLIQITADNRAKLNDLTAQDRELVDSYFANVPIRFESPEEVKTFVQGIHKEYVDGEIKMWDDTLKMLATLRALDGMTFRALHTTLCVIDNSLGDKYEADFPEVDLHGLKFMSPHGLGFNVGNAAKYLKRYMTDGFEKSRNPEDLSKAIHYLLFEIARDGYMSANQPPEDDKK